MPGTVIHELSHLLIALVLRVPTGPISIFPTFEKVSGTVPMRGQSPLLFGHRPHAGTVPFRVKVGHIMVAKTSPFRLTLIGVAPMVVGLAIIFILGNTFIGDSPRSGTVPFTVTIRGVLIYFLFITSTSMFSSRQDLKSLLITLPVIILIISALYLSGVKIVIGDSPHSGTVPFIRRILTDLNRSLILTAGIDYMVLVISTGLGWLSRSRLTGSR